MDINEVDIIDDAIEAATDNDEDEVDEIQQEAEDFWDAIDLLEATRKQLTALLKQVTLSPARQHTLTSLNDDIALFLNDYVDYAASNTNEE